MMIALSILSALLALGCTLLTVALRNMSREFGNPARARANLNETVRQVIKGADWRQAVVLREDLMDAVKELDTHGPHAEVGALWWPEQHATAQQAS